MVYAHPIDLSNTLSSDDTIEIMADPPTSKNTLRVYYNGIPVDSITGPVPLVDLSTDYNTSPGGIPQSNTTKVTLNGKIFRSTYYDSNTSSGSGTAGIVSAINKLKDLFKCNNGIFQIKCGTSTIIEGSGVQIRSAKFDKSSDNWIFTSDYSIELEYQESTINNSGILIKTGSDSWNLDPIDEYMYMTTDKTNGVVQKSEYHNPKLGASGAGGQRNTKIPNNDIVPGSAGTLLKFITLPRFKLSRTVSAVGLPNTSVTGACGSGTFTAYHQAKQWVENELAKPFKKPTPIGSPSISYNAITNIPSFENLFLYNHLRNIDFNHLDGSYKVSDTWLAMPTGVSYLEDYTLESSTDNKNIKTVTVAGTIKGLSISSLSFMSGQLGLIPDKSGVINLSGYNNLSSSGAFTINPKKLDNDTNSLNGISSHKYINAYSGWINDIKPFLYRRASSITNSLDRNTNYVSSLITPPQPLNNPIYSYERLLNIIPISTSEVLDPRKGSISYSYEFSNKFSLFSGVISENINISNNMPADVVNEAFVIGRQLGPVLQYMGTTTSATKSVTIELVVVPPSSMKGYLLTNKECPLYIHGPTYSGVKTLVNGLRPFGPRVDIFGNMNRAAATGLVQITKDTVGWNPTEGRFTKSVEWVYQPCQINVSLVSDLLKDL